MGKLVLGRRAHMDEPPADEAPCGRIACGAHARRSVSPPTKDEPADEEQRERTSRGARHLRSFSLASKADGPPGGVSLRHGCIWSVSSAQGLLGAERSIDCRTPSGPDPTAQMLLSGPAIVGKRDPSPSSSAQSPRSETKDWTL